MGRLPARTRQKVPRPPLPALIHADLLPRRPLRLLRLWHPLRQPFIFSHRLPGGPRLGSCGRRDAVLSSDGGHFRRRRS